MSASEFPPSKFPPPLLAGLQSPLERSILSAASADAPSAESREALLRSLGALGAIGAATTVATVATTATTTTTTGAASLAAKSTLLLTATKVAVGVAMVTAVAGGAWSIRRSDAPKRAVQSAQVEQMSQASVPAQAAARTVSPVAPAVVDPPAAPVAPVELAPVVPVVPAVPVAPATRPARVGSPHSVSAAAAAAPVPVPVPVPVPALMPVATDDLGREANALAGVRSALARGDVAAANRGLDAYASTFPNGQLQPEAEILRARVNKKITSE